MPMINMTIPHCTAALRGHTDIINTLLDLGAYINARNCKRETPLHKTAVYCIISAIDTLVERGAEMYAKDNSGNTALHIVAEAEFDTKCQKKAIKTFLAKGMPVDNPSESGSTPLHGAEKEDIASFLIKKGADVHYRNKEGMTTLDKAASSSVEKGTYKPIIDHILKTKKSFEKPECIIKKRKTLSILGQTSRTF